MTSVDPLAEKYYNISPYVYCHDNPVNRIDPDGKDDTTGTPSKKNKNGVDTTPQSTAAVKVPERIKPRQMPKQTDLQKAMKTAQSQSRGEIKDTNLENIKRAHNEAMNDPVAKQCLTDPALQTSASAILGGGVGAVAKTTASDVTPLFFRAAQIAIENPSFSVGWWR